MTLTCVIPSIDQVFGSIVFYRCLALGSKVSLTCEVEINKLFSALYKRTLICKSGKLFSFLKSVNFPKSD